MRIRLNVACIRIEPKACNQTELVPPAYKAKKDANVLDMAATVSLPRTVLADTGFATGPAVADLQKRGVVLLVAIGRTSTQQPYRFRQPTPPRTPRQITES